MLEFGEHLLNGVQIGRIFWQHQELCADLADCPADGEALVAAEIIHDDDVAWEQCRRQDLLDIDPKSFPVDRAIEKPGRFDAVVTQGGQESHCVPMPERGFGHQTFAFGRPSSQRRHVGFSPGFIDEYEARRIDPSLIPLPLFASARDIGAILLAGV